MAEPPADLARHLELGKMPRPGGEQGVATELVELAKDRHERVVGDLLRKVFEVPARGMLQPGGAAADFMAGLA
jgi:hypothetical protein